MSLDKILDRHRAPKTEPRREREAMADMLYYAQRHGHLPMRGEERIFAPAPREGFVRCRLVSATGADQWLYLREPGPVIRLPLHPAHYQVLVQQALPQILSPQERTFALHGTSGPDCREYREEVTPR